jgi:hypothetical protein
MSEESRHHHYIPQSYLRGFARSQSKKNWQIHVTDLREERTYPTNVRNVCGVRDFLRIQTPGHKPDQIEKEMSAFEAKFIEALRHVVSEKQFEGDSANQTLNLMALLAVRSPQMRENMRDFQERVAKSMLSVSLSSKDRWDAQAKQAQASGALKPSDTTYEEVKAFHESGQYVVEVPTESHMQTEFQLMDTVLPLLGRRRWTMYLADERSGEFITTDRPVTLTFVDPAKVPPFFRRSPGFGLPETEVFFPLTKDAILVGRWDQGGTSEIVDQAFIAAVNTHVATHSFGRVFSAKKDILFIDLITKQMKYGDLLSAAKKWRLGIASTGGKGMVNSAALT